MEDLHNLIKEITELICMESDYPKYSEVGDNPLGDSKISIICEKNL